MRALLMLFILIISSGLEAQVQQAYSHLTCSQVGSDRGFPKYAMLQDTVSDFVSQEATFTLRRIPDGKKMLSGKVEAPKEKWEKFWWTLDFSACNKPGEYYLEVYEGKKKVLESDRNLPVKIGQSMLWNESWYPTALEHLHIRDSLSYKPEGGWKDCGSTLQELSSHAIMLNALCDLLELAPGHLTEKNKQEIYYHLLVGADYVALCQDRAASFGYKEGAVVHKVRQNYKVVTGNVAKTAMILARISRIIKDKNHSKSDEYKSRSLKSYQWLEKYGPVMLGVRR